MDDEMNKTAAGLCACYQLLRTRPNKSLDVGARRQLRDIPVNHFWIKNGIV